MKCLLVTSNFLEVDKVIVSNWYQIWDNKLIREDIVFRFKINISDPADLVVAKRLYLKKLKEVYRHKEKIHGALIEK